MPAARDSAPHYQYLLYFRRAIKRGPIRDNFRQRRAPHLHGRASLFLTRFQRLDVDARSRRVQERRVLVDDHERTATLRALASALHMTAVAGACVRGRARAQRRRKTNTTNNTRRVSEFMEATSCSHTHAHTHAQSRQSHRYTRAAGANTRTQHVTAHDTARPRAVGASRTQQVLAGIAYVATVRL